MRRDRSGRGADVLSFECKRYQEALADEHLTPTLRAHEAECPGCAALRAELAPLFEDLREIAGPKPIPAGFTEGVLRRAEVLGADPARRMAVLDVEAPPGRGRWLRMAVGALVLATLTGVLVFGRGPGEEPRRLAVTPAPPVTVASSARQHEAEAPLPPTRPSPEAEGVAPAAVPIPEPTVDLAGELERTLKRLISEDESCPARSGGTIRLTVTLESTGRLADRQVLSAATLGGAHRCVNAALDRLALPPLSEPATITIELAW